MHKKLLLIPLMLSTFALVGLVRKNTTVKADSTNGYHLEEIYQDKFNKDELDSNWVLKDATVEHNYNGLHCISPLTYGSGPIMNAFRLAEKTNIRFTIYPNSCIDGANISFNIGMPSPTTTQKEPDVDARIQFWDDQLVFLNYQHNLAVDKVNINSHVLRGFTGLYSDLLETEVSLYITRKSSTQTSMYAEYIRGGEVVYTNEATPFVLENPRYADGYCGFFWDCVEMDLTNFEAYNNDVLVFEDCFEENTLTYTATEYTKGNFHVVGDLNESKVYISKVGSIKMDNANEAIFNKVELTKQENITNPYEIDYSVKINELNANSFIGFGYGLKDGDNKIDATNAIGFVKKDNLTAEVVAIRNGVVDNSNHYQIALAKLGIGKYIDYTVTFDYTNNAYLTIGGQTYKFENISFYGQTAIGLVDLGANTSSSIELKQFAINRNSYSKLDSIDASNDFKGKKEAADEFDFDKPYLNDQKYFVGSNVALEEDWVSGEVALTFTNANPYSGFGYRKQYSEWICEFDADIYSHNNDQMIGLSFGRQSVVDVLMQASTSNSAFILSCTFDDNGNPHTNQIAYGANCKFDNGKNFREETTINIYDLNNTKYHFMFIAKNRNVYCYYKDVNAPDSELGICRAVLPNVNTDGYVSIVGNNYASFGITNYKIVNLSDECTSESELTLRESFNNKNNVSEKISLGTSKVVDDALLLKNSAVKTVNKTMYEIIRFTTENVENKLQVMFSTNKKVVFDVNNNQIVIDEDGEKTTYDCSEINLKYIKGKRFEIMIMGNEINISYKGYYDPQDKLNTTVITHTLKSALVKDNITLSSTGSTTIDDLYIFALDNSAKCATYNYEDDPNTAQTWFVKKDYDPSKVYNAKGCTSSSSAAILALGLLGLVPVLASKKRKEEE